MNAKTNRLHADIVNYLKLISKSVFIYRCKDVCKTKVRFVWTLSIQHILIDSVCISTVNTFDVIAQGVKGIISLNHENKFLAFVSGLQCLNQLEKQDLRICIFFCWGRLLATWSSVIPTVGLVTNLLLVAESKWFIWLLASCREVEVTRWMQVAEKSWQLVAEKLRWLVAC